MPLAGSRARVAEDPGLSSASVPGSNLLKTVAQSVPGSELHINPAGSP
jgi:hypothetical protein